MIRDLCIRLIGRFIPLGLTLGAHKPTKFHSFPDADRPSSATPTAAVCNMAAAAFSPSRGRACHPSDGAVVPAAGVA